jgi:hypothetical protein
MFLFFAKLGFSRFIRASVPFYRNLLAGVPMRHPIDDATQALLVCCVVQQAVSRVWGLFR